MKFLSIHAILMMMLFVAGDAFAADAPAESKASGLFNDPSMKPPPPTTVPTTTATTGPATRPVLTERLKIDVMVKSVSIEQVAIRKVLAPGAPKPKYPPKDRTSDEKLLVIKIEIHNDCQTTELTLEDLDGLTPETSPSLEDAVGNGYPSARFEDFRPVGANPLMTLKPGESATDVLVFAPPPIDTSPLHLRFRKRVLGRSVPLQVDIDPNEIKRK